MPHVTSFAAIEDASASVLILGSMPGVLSLREQQYYAHPRNVFWGIMGELMGAYPSEPYERRVNLLRSRKIALWDVLQSCTREGSLDSAIDETTLVTNDFTSFYQSHPGIERVYFNGSKAEQVYRRYVKDVIVDLSPRIHYQRLPSTSPAHAAKSFEEKLAVWKCIV
ncbi:MAG: DNA-deoxyinosine glycosylase [Gammaproteobacteria bacterium]|nr:MAG: DNA-deoxyinosine glycosylase [Gammaproteobacteria bacterium]